LELLDSQGNVYSTRHYGEHCHSPRTATQMPLSKTTRYEIEKQVKLGVSNDRIYQNMVTKAEDPLNSAKVPNKEQIKYIKKKITHEQFVDEQVFYFTIY